MSNETTPQNKCVYCNEHDECEIMRLACIESGTGSIPLICDGYQLDTCKEYVGGTAKISTD